MMIKAGMVLLLLGVSAAHAGVIVALDPATISVPAGGSATYYGRLSNSGPDDIYLNGTLGILPFVGLLFDDSLFYANTPALLAINQTYEGPLFVVTVAGTVSPGLYEGSFTVQGGLENVSYSDLDSQSFQVNVTAVPEPGGVGWLAGMMATGMLWKRSRRARRERVSSQKWRRWRSPCD